MRYRNRRTTRSKLQRTALEPCCQRAEAQLKVAQNEGAYSTLVADADGTVMETLAEPGQFVSAGQIVVRVARAGAREAVVNLPETLRPALGSTAHATLYGAIADSATRYPARLRQLSDAADPLTRTFEARYVLDGAAASAPLGATVTVYLNDSEQAGALAVPLGAIDDEGHGPGVWLLDRKVLLRSVPSGQFVRFDGERAIVRGGIQMGDPIIAVGGHFLHEGQQVHIVEAARRESDMSQFNLSALAVRERSITLFLIVAIILSGSYAFLRLGRAEDPSFAIKTLTVTVVWPGATAKEMQDLVAEPLEKRMQELRWYDRVETFTRPGIAVMMVTLSDKTPPAAVAEEFYQARKKLGDEAPKLPTGVQGPFINDEYSDVIFAVYALEAHGMPPRELTREAETLRQRLLHVPGVKKVNIQGERPERIFVEFSYARLANLGVPPRDIFGALQRQNAVTPAGSIDTNGPQVFMRLDGAYDDLQKIRDTPIAAGGTYAQACRTSPRSNGATRIRRPS